MQKPKLKTDSKAFANLDGRAFARAYGEWLEAGGREELDKAMEAVSRDVRVLKRSLEVRPEMLSEAVTF